MENIFVEFLPPWVETGLQPAFYDKESGTVLQQTARMYARVNMLIRMFNKLSKNTKTTVEDYINQFNELHDYVHDYFDNLDVQEEINNKLDAMVEAGTLQEIITTYIQTNVAWTFDSVADMKASTNLIAGSYAQTLGYYIKNDGGKALYAIVGTEPSTYHFPIGNNLYAVLISSNVHVDQLGANGGNQPLSHYFDTLEEAQAVYPNATALTELVGGVAIQCAIDYFYYNDIYFGNRIYYTNTQLNVTDTKRIHFIGTNFGKSIIKRTDEGTSDNNNIILNLSRITSTPTKNVIENIDFIGPHSGDDTSEATLNTYYTIGIDMYYSSYNVIRNCTFMYLKSGVHANYSWTNVFDNCFFDRNNSGIDTYSSSAFNDVEINHCYFVHNNRGLYLGEGRSQLVINCDIEKNNLDGLRRTNSGDIQIINTYFEDKIFIPVAQTAVQNILITGCSFYQDSTNTAFYTPIRYDGEADVTQVTIMNCNFIDGNSSAVASNSAIAEYSGSDMRPVLMNNTTIHMREYNPSGMRGIHIKNGLIHNYLERSFSVNYINATSGGESSLTLNNAVYYRLNVPVSGTHSIKLPTVPVTNEYFDTRFQFIVGSNMDSGREGNINIIPDNSSTCDVTGHTTITYADKNKIIEAVYEGGWGSKSHWSVTVSA